MEEGQGGAPTDGCAAQRCMEEGTDDRATDGATRVHAEPLLAAADREREAGDARLAAKSEKERTAVACVMVLVVAFSMVGTALLDKLLVDAQNAPPPLVLSVFIQCWDLLGFALGAAAPRRPTELSPRRLAKAGAVLMLLSQLSNVGYLYALQQLDTSLAALVCQSATVWVFVFSRCLLPEWVNPLTFGATAAVAGGVVLIALDDGSAQGGWARSNSLRTYLPLLCGAAAAAGLHDVSLRATLGRHAAPRECLLLVGWRGAANVLLLAPTAAALWGARVVHVPPVAPERYRLLCGVGALSLLGACARALGVVLTSPLFVRVGGSLSGPAMVGWAAAYHREAPGLRACAGSAMVVAAFALMNVPWESAAPRFRRCAVNMHGACECGWWRGTGAIRRRWREGIAARLRSRWAYDHDISLWGGGDGASAAHVEPLNARRVSIHVRDGQAGRGSSARVGFLA